MTTNHLRIRTVATTDYPWPFVAILERHDGKGWIEVDAEGGDTDAEALENLRAENHQAARVLHPPAPHAR